MPSEKILVIIQDASTGGRIIETLDRLGYRTGPQLNSTSGLQKYIREQEPDLILIDGDLAVSESFNPESLKSITGWKVPYVYVISSENQEVLKQAGSPDFFGFIRSPYSEPFLQAVVESSLQRFSILKDLAEREERYRIVADFTYDWEYWLTPEGEFVYVSTSCQKITGYSPEEFQQDPDLYLRIVHPDDQELVKAHRRNASSTVAIDEPIKFRLIRRDGSIAWIQHLCRPVFGKDGGFLGSRASNRDITARQRIDEKLIESEARYRSLFEESPVSLWVEDFSGVKMAVDELVQQGITDFRAYFTQHPDEILRCLSQIRILDVNKATLQLYKAASKEELIANTGIILPEQVLKLMLEELVSIADGKTMFEGEGINQTLDGNLIDINIFWSVPPEQQQNLSNVIVTILDVTLRKQRQRSLETIAGVSNVLRSAQTRAEMLPVILEQVSSLLGCHSSAVVLLSPAGHNLQVEHATGGWAASDGRPLRLHSGLTGKVMDEGQPFASISWQPEDLLEPPLAEKDSCALVVLPLVTEEVTIGALWVGRSEPFTDEEVGLLTSIADISAIAIYRTSLHEQTRLYADHMTTVNRLSEALSRTFNLAEIYDQIQKAVMDLVPDTATLYISLYDPLREWIDGAYAFSGGRVLPESGLTGYPLEAPGVGTQSEVIRSGQGLVVNDLQKRLKTVRSRLYLGGITPTNQSGIYLPLRVKGEVLGVIQVQSDLPNRFQPEDIDRLSPVANTAAIAIKNARLFTETEQRLQRLSALHALDMAISSSLDLRVTLNILLDQVINILDNDAADVLLFNPGTQMLEYSAGRGFRGPVTDRSPVRLGEELAGRAAVSGKGLSCSTFPADAVSAARAAALAGEDFVSVSVVPLMAKGQAKGIIEIFHRQHLNPDSEWMSFLETLAGQAAVAIDNTTLFNQLQRSNLELTLAYDTTLEGWSRALDLRDRETEGHTQRVTEITLRLAAAMGLSEQEIVHLRRGALLHDIGKMGIPDSILNKPAALTEEEWVLMRMHPVYAYEMLSPITFLALALDIPYCHHEKWDGSGYPRRLKGEQIPLPARIFAIVDVWDSLCSNRPYRSAWPEAKTRQYILEQSGTHFDPRVVDAFMRITAPPV